MKKKRIIVLVLILVCMSLGIRNLDLMLRYNMNLFEYYSGQGGIFTDEKAYKMENAILVGVYDDPPLAYINAFNNHNVGILIDYLSQLTIELSHDIHIKPTDRNKLTQAVQTGDVDMAIVQKTAGNEAFLDFSQPLCVLKGKILVKNDDSIKSVGDLENKTLVTLKGEGVKEAAEAFFKGKTSIKIIEVDNMYQCFALIRNQEAVGFAGDDMEVAHFLNVTNKGSNFKFLEPTLYTREMCLAVKKGNTEFLHVLDKGILKLKKKDLIFQTQYKWLGDFESHGIELWKLDMAYKVISGIIAIVAFFSIWNYLITQKVNTRTRELSESKAQLRLIIDTLHRGILVIENDSTIVECNDAISDIVGVKREAIRGEDYRRFEILRVLIDENETDEVFNVHDVYYYITSQSFGNNKRLLMIEDYTEKYFSERRARQESKMIAVGQLSAGLAHEIRNPLGLIKSYIYIIEKYSKDEMFKHAVFVINNSVGRINHLIENLLRFSKLSNEDRKLVDIENLVDLILALEEKNLEKNSIEVVCSLPDPDKRLVVMNEDILKMILLNLINNGIESFADIKRDRKTIELSINIESDKLIIRVADNGCGIEKDKLENVFNPFYSTKESGTGLGLYLISTEIFNNNGTISVDSKVDEGTEFSIVLPIKEK